MTTRRPFGLGEGPMLHLLVMAETTERGMGKTLRDIEQDYIRMLAETEPPKPTRAEAMQKNTNASKNRSANGTTVLGKSHGSNQARDRIAKLKRDHPEVAEKLAKGAYQTLPPPPPPPR